MKKYGRRLALAVSPGLFVTILSSVLPNPPAHAHQFTFKPVPSLTSGDGACNEGGGSALAVDLCGPDPYGNLCAKTEQLVSSNFIADQVRAQTLLRNFRQDTGGKLPGMEEVRSNLKRVAQTFASVIQKSKELSARDKAYLIKRINICSSNFLIDRDPKAFAFPNAAINVKAPMGECATFITPKLWAACSSPEDALCMETLFHEMGHVLNVCNYVGGYRSKETSELAQHLNSSTDCLAFASHPKNAIPNACPESRNQSEFEMKHCGSGSVTGYPSQWLEAEADLWGSSAIGEWLKSKSSIVQRKTILKDVFQRWCIYQGLSKQSQLERSHDLLKGDPRLCSRTAKEDRYYIEGTEKNTVPQWNDEHQDFGLRMNINYLGNSDLRGALGCSPIAPDLASACSPTSGGTVALPAGR